jgi:hypothetical protein
MDNLSNKWTLWYHHINDEDWSENSYTKIKELETLNDYLEIKKYLDNVSAGMFFLMRENIFPRWEDINNIDGGYWSYRILKKDAKNLWYDSIAYLIGNTLTNDLEYMNDINGMSISPKINNCIIKIWNKDFNNIKKYKFNTNIITLLGESIYKKHQDQTDLMKN